MKGLKRILAAALCVTMGVTTLLGMSGCSSVTGGKRIIRISHAQSETHPEHIGLLKFKEYVEENLGSAVRCPPGPPPPAGRPSPRG